MPDQNGTSENPEGPTHPGHPEESPALIAEAASDAIITIDQLLALQHSITRVLSESSSIPETAFSILKAICLGLGCQTANFWLLDEIHELRKIASYPPEHAEGSPSVGADHSDLASPTGIVGRAWTSQNPIWENYHSGKGSSASAPTTEEDQKTAVGYPIKFEKKMLGVLHLLDKGALGPDSDFLAVLGAIGGQIGQFIDRKNAENERSRLLARELEARQEAQAATRQLVALQKVTDAALAHLSLDALLDELLNRVRDVLHVDTVAILLLRPSGDELIAWAARGLEEEVELGVRIPVGKGFAGRVVAEGRPVIIEDVARYASRKDAEGALAAGFDRHFPKPVDPDELVRVVEDLLRLKSAENTPDT